MRIAYATNVRLPSERAHGHQIARVCDALAKLGHRVTVLAPFRKNTVGADFRAYEKLPSSIGIEYSGSFDPIASLWLPGILGLWWMNRTMRAAIRSRVTPANFDLAYTRSPALLPALLVTGVPVVLELHQIPRMGTRSFIAFCNKCALVACLTTPMADALHALGVERNKLIVEGDAVDTDIFDSVPDAWSVRRSFGVPEDAALIVYTGQLQSMGLSKGVPELVDALGLLAKIGRTFRAVIAGGPDTVAENFRDTLPAALQDLVTFPGHLLHEKIPPLLSAADVLVYPAPQSDHPYYNRDTSPLKLFEYMAAGRPIVTADLPPIHDALDDTMAVFCAPGDSIALADAINRTLNDKDASRERARLAKEHVRRFTWEKRMERIMEKVMR